MPGAGCRRSGPAVSVVVARFYSIFLVVILLSGLFRDGVTIVLFKLNQVYIASTLCVNRDKPMTMCGGSCYLKKKLERNHEEQQPYPAGRTKDTRPLEFYSCAMLFAGPETNAQDVEPFRVYDDIPFSHEFVTGIFRPPKI